jgi:hypothetical protein
VVEVAGLRRAGDLGGEIVKHDRLVRRRHHQALDESSRAPGYCRETSSPRGPRGIGGEGPPASDLAFELGQHHVHQVGDVPRMLTQGRDIDGEHIEPVIEIAAEASATDHLGEIAIGGGHHPERWGASA